MIPVFAFDAYKTIVDCPSWDRLKQEDPEVRELFEQFQSDRATWSRPFMAKMDEYIAQGKVGGVEVPGTVDALEQLAAAGSLAVYSTATEKSLPILLETAGLGHLFRDHRLVIPVERLDNIPKTSPVGFQKLDAYLKHLGFKLQAYVDDELAVISAGLQAGISFPEDALSGFYHLDRNADLQTRESGKEYTRISKLGHMIAKSRNFPPV